MTAHADLDSRLAWQSSASASLTRGGNAVGNEAEGEQVSSGEERKAAPETA